VFPTHPWLPWEIAMPAMSLHRRALVRLAMVCLAATPTPLRAADSAVIAPIQHLYDALLAVMKAGHAPFAQRFDQLSPVIDAVFDLPAVMQASVGPSWNALSADQHSALLTAFRRYTIATYVANFDSFDGQRFEISPDTRALPNNEQVVTSRIISASGDPHRLDYVMRQVNGAWQVVDVLADGTISRVAVQRSDFRRLLTQGGSAALVVSLQSKAAQLGGG
jgi:phospholipid transport system substrate-binding protein